MSQLSTNPSLKAKPSNNIYTALVFIAFVALVAGVWIVWSKNVEITGDTQVNPNFKNPFVLIDRTSK